MNKLTPLLQRLAEARLADEPLIEVQIFSTEGSTYRKIGARMFIDRDHRLTGLVSGGCLEQDLLHHVDALFDDGQTRLLDYDMRTDDDLLWGMSAGCNGRIQLQLQRLANVNDYGGLGRAYDNFPHKTQLITCIDTQAKFGWQTGQKRHVPSGFESSWFAHCQQKPQLIEHNNQRYLCELIEPPKRLTCFGATPDAISLALLAQMQGFQVQCLDHRPAYVEQARSHQLSAHDPAESAFNISSSDAIVIINHHFMKDAHCLRQALDSQASYIALLGPAERRNRLLKEAELNLDQFDQKLFSPAGLDIGADTPEQIALSVMAQCQAVLTGADCKALRDKQAGIHD